MTTASGSTDLGPDDPHRLAATAADVLSDRLGTHEVAVVLGSGWSGVGEQLGRPGARMPMAALTGAVAPSVAGHSGTATSVDVDGTPTLVLAGRAHLYEGHDAATVVHAVRAAVLHGCRVVCLTNAAGSLRSTRASTSTASPSSTATSVVFAASGRPGRPSGVGFASRNARLNSV